ncbi:MAG: AAA-like domain-containing protein [Aphanizomenon gracile PMC649.10]|nr:AAA-like domain-containing protein [Aphanizomenon gracile PMC638.10]MDM3856431.1 AAA-like domain-containing protein [Aphanizomenon gracile PMC649.10]
MTQQFSALLRAWHEKAKTEEIWQNLRLVIAYSQEVDISINLNQSPFNVGLSVEIGEFNTTQIKELVEKYGLNFSDSEITQVRDMIDGHPYLLTTALGEIAKGNFTLSNFLEIAPTNESPYGKFLNFYVSELAEDKLLKAAMQQVINSDIPIKIDSTQALKLRSLGLIKFKGNDVQCLCNLYRFYFQERI